MGDEQWQVMDKRSGHIGPVVGRFLVGTWATTAWAAPVLNGVPMTWEEFHACAPPLPAFGRAAARTEEADQ